MEVKMADIRITKEDLIYIIENACFDMEEQKNTLRELDAQIGDGDLGVTVELGCQSVRRGIAEIKDSDLGTIFAKSGMNFSKDAPSTFGILMASILMGASKPLMKKDYIILTDLPKMAEEAERSVRSRGKADVGDKTLLDALVPSVKAVNEAVHAGKNIAEVIDAVVEAAEKGMKATIPLRSKQGRARWQQDRTIGIQDAGATAIYLIIESCARHLKSRLDSA
jgi:dihydroxyacetone kinase-like protein